MSHIVCTSFSPRGYELYGKKFLETYLAHWDTPLVVFYEKECPPIRDSRIEYRDLLKDNDLLSFLSDCDHLNPKHYNWQAAKFARKVYAITTPNRPKCDWWIWLDADVVTTKKIDDRFFEEACPGGYCAAYLGRKDWHHSETGYVAYSMRYHGDEFLARLREIYDTGQIFNEKEWHDAFLWDVVRREFEKRDMPNGQITFHNLSQGVPGIHVWPNTILGEYMTHQKGGELKRQAYGAPA